MRKEKRSTPTQSDQWLPSWAKRDHPIVKRELGALPNFFGVDGNLGQKTVLFAILSVVLVPCSCAGCGGTSGLLGFVFLAIPIVWSASTFNREITSGTWDVIRITPYTTRDIILAKMMAVIYRLSPLLALILVGQLLVLLASTLFIGPFMALGGIATTPAITTDSVTQFADLWRLWAPALVVSYSATVISNTLHFITNVMLGMMTSSLTKSRGMAILSAVSLRVLFSTLTMGVSFVITLLIALDPASGMLAGMGALSGQATSMWSLGGSTTWLSFVPIMIMTLLQILIFFMLFAITRWRVNRI